MSIWDNFGQLNKLEIGFKEEPSSKTALIFGNGNNQVAVSIKVDISAKDGKPLILPDDELLKVAHIVNYKDGTRLNRQGSPDNDTPWYYTDENFGYEKVIKWSDYLVVATEVLPYGYEQEVVFYLSATEESSIYISAGIDIPGVGDFNTSENGTQTKNGPGGETGEVFKSPQSIWVEATRVYKNPPVKVVKEIDSKQSRVVKKVANLADDIIYTGENNNLKFSVIPDLSYQPRGASYQVSIKDVKFTSIDFPRGEANLNTVKFRDDILPDMIIGRGGEKFSAYFVFVNHKVPHGIEKGSYFQARQDSTGIKYRYETEASNYRAGENEILITINEFVINFPDVGKYDWFNQYKDIIIDVIDNYGNSYQVKLRVDYSSEELFSVSSSPLN